MKCTQHSLQSKLMREIFRLVLVASVCTVGTCAAALPFNESPQYCGACHTRIYQEWKSSAMGRNLHDAMVYQFYTGTNAAGKKDGLGYQGLHPGKTGDCADCHVPMLVLRQHAVGHKVDLGVAMRKKLDYGISCYFCHSVQSVHITKDSAGRYRTRLYQTVTLDHSGAMHGPLKNAVSPAHATKFSPEITQSEFCASCHLNQEKFLSISTYVDWKKAYDSGKTRETCQDCHMPLHKKAVRVAVGGPKLLGVRSHSFIGASDPGLLHKALSLAVSTHIEATDLIVKTTVENVGAGHNVPGSGPIRNVILKVDATGPNGKPLTFVGNAQDLLPNLAGVGNPVTGKRDAEDWAGLPGRMYAKVYRSAVNPRTGKAMVGVGGFTADSVAFDTALRPLEPNVATFRFRLPAVHGLVHVQARLVYRWAFKSLADLKGWRVTDRPMRTVSRSVAW